MGGTGSGNKTSRSLGWDVIELAERLLSYIERVSCDETVELGEDWLAEQQAKLGSLKSQYKAACERERTTSNGKHA